MPIKKPITRRKSTAISLYNIMKSTIALFFLLIAGSLLMSDSINGNWDETTSLIDIAEKTGIPVKSLIKNLDLDKEYWASRNDRSFLIKTPTDFGKTKIDVQQAIELFAENNVSFITGITIIGMLVVFVSLIAIGIIIQQLKHLNRKKKPEKVTVTTSVGKITVPEPDVSTNAIVAVITALHIHVKEVRDKKKLLLTWNRGPVSMWKASNHVHLLNRESRRSTR
ncbi:MAG: OadG family protein [Candidatus Cloacimonetes bacterium]|nr:OadG family protein [Candidatus Cloacimonadota bacterium]